MCGLVKWRGVREVREWNLRSTNSQTPASLNFPRYFVAIAAFNNNCFSFRSAAQKLNGNRPQRRNQSNQSIKEKKKTGPSTHVIQTVPFHRPSPHHHPHIPTQHPSPPFIPTRNLITIVNHPRWIFFMPPISG